MSNSLELSLCQLLLDANLLICIQRSFGDTMQRACCLKYTLIISFHSHCISWHAPFFHFFGFCTDELLRGGWMMQSSHTLCVMEGKAKAVFQSKHVQELLKACEKEKIQHRVRWELILLALSLTLSGSSTVAAVGGSCGTSSWSEMQKTKQIWVRKLQWTGRGKLAASDTLCVGWDSGSAFSMSTWKEDHRQVCYSYQLV